MKRFDYAIYLFYSLLFTFSFLLELNPWLTFLQKFPFLLLNKMNSNFIQETIIKKLNYKNINENKIQPKPSEERELIRKQIFNNKKIHTYISYFISQPFI